MLGVEDALTEVQIREFHAASAAGTRGDAEPV